MDRTIIFVGIVIIIILGIILWAVEVYYRRSVMKYLKYRFDQERKKAIRRIDNDAKTEREKTRNVIQNTRAVTFLEAMKIMDEEI